MSSAKTSRKSKTVVEETPAPAPAPVVVEPVVMADAAVEEQNETFESLMTQYMEKQSQVVTLQKEMSTLLKTAMKQHGREVKAGGKSRRSAPKKDRAPSGFAKATPVPEALRKFLKIDEGVELPRTEVAKQIYAYVRDKDLRAKDDRRVIHPDKALQKLFSLKDGETLDFRNFQKQLSRHYPKAAGKVEEVEVAEVPAPVAVAAPEAPAPSKRRSRAAGATA
jgi:chromatin remodeling complex protein RSC6